MPLDARRAIHKLDPAVSPGHDTGHGGKEGSPGMEKTNNSIWNRGFTCAFFANLLLCLSQNTANTLISTYAGYLGAGAVLVGAISGLYFGVAFAARPISGPVMPVSAKLCNFAENIKRN